MVPNQIEDIPVRVVNLSKKLVNICAVTLVSNLEQVEVCSTQEETPVKVRCRGTTLQGMVDRVDKTVGKEDRQRLLAMLNKFSITFSRGNNDPSYTNVITHIIDTEDSKHVLQAI